MRVEVLVIQRGDGHPLYHWHSESRRVQDLQAQKKWEEACLTIVRKQHEHGGLQPEAFLCLRDNSVVGYDYDLIRSWLGAAHNFIWAAHLYVVLDTNAGLSEETRATELDSIDAWFTAIERNGVTDVIQCDLRVNEPDPLNAQEIASALDRISHRNQITQPLLHQQTRPIPWRCIFYPSANGDNPLLAEYVASKKDSDTQHVILVLAGVASNDLSGFLRHKLKKSSNRIQVVAVLDPISRKDVERACDSLKLPNPVKVLHFGGLCELRFFLQQLNAYTEAVQVLHRSDERIIQVSPFAEPVFQSHDGRAMPSLLLTNSFHADQESSDCIAAGLDIGKVMREVPRTAWRGTHHAVDLVQLTTMLSSDRVPDNLTTWLHLGHGIKKGLQEYTLPRYYRSPEEWLRCFGGRKRSLALAFFSTCYSFEIAELFARAGAGVAIGFARPVDPDTCRILSAPVIRAALYSNGSPQAILEAFRQAMAYGRLKAEPKAFSSYPQR